MAKETTSTETSDLDLRLIQYKIDLEMDADLTQEQREEANEDMIFIHRPGGMWEGFFDDTLPTSTERIKMQFDLTSAPRDKFIGNWNQNRVNVEFKPDDSATSDDDADLINGIYRTDYRQFSGKLSTDNAVDELSDCGIGALELFPLFEDEEDPENDNQRIGFGPIPNSYNSIYWDSNAKRIDKMDAMRCTKLTRFTKQAFENKYPGEKPISAYNPTDWQYKRRYMANIDEIFIATRYSIIRKKANVYIYNNLELDEVEIYSEKEHKLIEDELKKDEFRKFVKKRRIIKQTVERSVFSGDKFLEDPERIAGKWIPIISFYGYRGFVDDVEWYHGFVRPLKDANRAFNMQISQIMENAAAGNHNKPIFDPEQVEGPVGASWADMVNKPFAVAHALRDGDGNVIQAGPLGYTQTSTLDQNTAALLEIIPNFIQNTTGGAPQETLDPKASGKAINALLKQENLKTQPVMDNIVNAIEWMGTVYAAMAAEIYDSQRMVRVTGQDGTEGTKILFEQIVDEQTGKLIEANTIRGKKFKVYSDVGPAYESQREASVEEGKAMLEAFVKTPGAEKYVPALISTIIENTAGTNLGPLKKIARNDMITQGLIDPETEEEKQMLAQAQQPQEDPQAKLMEAAANQQNAEARNMDSDSQDNVASAEKKRAETAKIISEIQNEKVKTLLQIRKEQLEEVNRLPI